MLKYFDFNKDVMLSVDASAEGLGAVLLQEGQPVAFGSRSLTECQKRYAQIEKSSWRLSMAARSSISMSMGRQYKWRRIISPGDSIQKGSPKSSSKTPEMLMRLQLYDLRVSYKPGKDCT